MTAAVFLSILLIAQPQQDAYGAAVTFEQGKCIYWTGDVVFTASEFQNDLRERFDVSRAINIRHKADVPARCVDEAMSQARQAGFKDVRSTVDPDAGPIGP